MTQRRPNCLGRSTRFTIQIKNLSSRPPCRLPVTSRPGRRRSRARQLRARSRHRSHRRQLAGALRPLEEPLLESKAIYEAALSSMMHDASYKELCRVPEHRPRVRQPESDLDRLYQHAEEANTILMLAISPEVYCQNHRGFYQVRR